MTGPQREWLRARELTSRRLTLEPLREDHAAEAFATFDDQRLHAFTGGAPADRAAFTLSYQHRAEGQSPDGQQGWLNWLLRTADGSIVGTVQATLQDAGEGEAPTAELAWVIGVTWQNRGYAREAAVAITAWLVGEGVEQLTACIHPEHLASNAVACACGLTPTDRQVGGEIVWARVARQVTESGA